MFVKKTVRRRGDKSYEYLSLVEAVREDGKNTHRTLLRFGEVTELRASGQLDRIINALRTYAEGNWFEAGELSGEGGPSLGGVAACHAYFSSPRPRGALRRRRQRRASRRRCRTPCS